MTKPLAGVRVLEFDGIGPAPFAGRILSDMGAAVTVIVRSQRSAVAERLFGPRGNPWHRGKRTVSLDLKTEEGRDQALSLVENSDVLIEGNRPGVMERLGLGPRECLARKPTLVYGRVTGWGQTGPLARAAGHDLNYVALTGLLSLSASPGAHPAIPPTVVGDSTGALGLAFGVTCALLRTRETGVGGVVDAAIVDLVAMMGSIAQSIRAAGELHAAKPSPFHDSPFYDVYECADGGLVTVCALEPQFYRLLLEKIGLADVNPATQYDRSTWPDLKARFREVFLGKSRDEWSALLEGTDVCFAPVLTLEEAVTHPHNAARQIYSTAEDGEILVRPAPRL